MKDLPNLDLLRAMAVTFVVFGHTLEAKGVPSILGFNYGYLADLGVAIFFVHTCLVLMWSLERNPDTLGFYVRRAFRIYPLAIVTVLVVVCFRIPVGVDPTHNYQGLVTPWQLPANLLLVQNVFKQPNVMGPLWTLPNEVQMYVLLPFLFAFVRFHRLLWPLLCLWAFTIVLNLKGTRDLRLLVTVLPLFLPGVISYVAFKKFRPVFPAWLMPCTVLGMCAAVTFYPKLQAEYLFALTLGLMLPLFRQVTSPLATSASLTIARYSYGVYLSHAFAILVGVHMLAKHSLWIQLPVVLLIVAATVIPAFHLIEAPMIEIGRRTAERLARRHGVRTTGQSALHTRSAEAKPGVTG